MAVTLAPGISHRPGSSSENIIQPVVDATGLILRPFSNGQSAPVFQVQNVDGTAVHFGLNPDGEIQLLGGVGTNGQVLTSAGAGNPVAWSTPSGGDLSAAVILAPGSVGRNLIQPTADGDSLTLRPFSDAQTSPVLRVQNAAGSGPDLLEIGPDGHLGIGSRPAFARNWIVAGDDNTIGVVLQASPASTPGNGDTTFQVNDRNGAGVFAVADSGSGAVVFCNAQTPSDTALVVQGNGVATRDIFQVVTGGSGHLVFRVAEDKLGFFNAPAVVRQTGASTAGIAAVTDANARAALSALQTAFASLGLVTSPA